MECKQYFIEGKREHIFKVYQSYHKPLLEEFLLGDCKTWAGNRPFVTGEVVKRLLPLHRVELGQGETAIPAR